MVQWEQFVLGAAVTACAAVGLLFLRSWRRTRERLFVFFALTFWLLALDWVAVAAFGHGADRAPHHYLLRLAAFVLLLLGIWDKNRGRRRRPHSGAGAPREPR